MKTIALISVIALPFFIWAQKDPRTKNIVIVAIDGFRWQEVFTGADPSMINDARYTKDTSLTNDMYGAATAEERRQKLMPFFWNTINKKGQLYGNRFAENKVNVKNIYKISYAGYNEMLTGYADWRCVPNTPTRNRNTNILEHLNQQPGFTGKVAAFTSWNIFPYILNEQRNKLPINSGYDALDDIDDTTNILINQVQENVADKEHTRYDMLTFLGARQYLQQKHPRVLFLGFGETDEFAHAGQYDRYLQQATSIDQMIQELWYQLQTDPFYKDQTTLIITTDHGRGRKPYSWHRHGIFTKCSGETWMAIMGPDVLPSGEMKARQQTYTNQIVPTVSLLLGQPFDTPHTLATPIETLVPRPVLRHATDALATKK